MQCENVIISLHVDYSQITIYNNLTDESNEVIILHETRMIRQYEHS